MKLLAILFLMLNASVYAQSAEPIVLKAGQQARVTIEGCSEDHTGVAILKGQKLTANCEPKVCITHASGWNGSEKQSISRIDILPTNEEISVTLKGNRLIKDYIENLLQTGVCAKARIYWVGETTSYNF